MAKISFNVEIKGVKFKSSINLEGQDLYFFDQRSEEGKIEWIIECLKRGMKINDIRIKD